PREPGCPGRFHRSPVALLQIPAPCLAGVVAAEGIWMPGSVSFLVCLADTFRKQAVKFAEFRLPFQLPEMPGYHLLVVPYGRPSLGFKGVPLQRLSGGLPNQWAEQIEGNGFFPEEAFRQGIQMIGEVTCKYRRQVQGLPGIGVQDITSGSQVRHKLLQAAQGFLIACFQTKGYL